MKKTTFLKMLIITLVMIPDFSTYSQNLISFNTNVKNDFKNIFLNSGSELKGQATAGYKNEDNFFLQAVESENPVIKYAQNPYAGIVSQCPDDGSLLPKLFLCGLNDSRLIQTGIKDAVFIKWQRKTGGCPSASNGNCANRDLSCTWADVAEGPDYAANSSGEFRVKIRYQNNTESVFYFNVYKNEVDPTGIIKSDIINDEAACNIPGHIIAGGFGSGYEYSLTTNPAPGNWQDSNVFKVSNPDIYNVFIRLKGVDGGCVYNVKNIVVSSINFASSSEVVQPSCFGDKGIIKVASNALNKQLRYEIYKNGNAAPLYTVGPVAMSEYEFVGLDPGSYRVVSAIDGNCAVDEQIVQINSAEKVINNSSVTQPLTACTNGLISISGAGGSKPYKYSVSVDGSGFEAVPNGTVIVAKGGTYITRVEDLNSCIVDKTITISGVTKPEYTIEAVNGQCGEGSSINVKITNDNGFTIEYSKDSGLNFQKGSSSGISFTNLSTGEYNIVLRYTKIGVNNGNSCSDEPHIVNVGAATPLTASAGIGSLSGCGPASDPSQGIARITNAQGGIPYDAPNLYLYSFDNKLTWVTQNEGFIKPGGPYSVFIKDAAGCIFEMGGLVLDPKPATPSIEINDPVYNCDGTANTTVMINGGQGDPRYMYQYYLDGQSNPNTASPNVFLNVPAGDHYITVDYNVVAVSTYSNLLDESFGRGDNTTSPGINSFYYCFERQIPGQPATYCNDSYAINDGDYSVTSSINQDATSDWGWRYPKDHTSNGTDNKGRFLAVNIGNQIPVTTILYEKQINDVIPNQPINFDFYAMNLMMPGAGNSDADLRIALVDASGKEISWFATGPIARSGTDKDWKHFPELPITLNPGNNTSLRFIIRSNVRDASGNDVAIDDIRVFQIPKACGAQSLFKFKINPNKVFAARVDNITDVKCNGESSGSFQIYAENYADTFEYSIDGKQWVSSSLSPVIINNLEAKSYNVKIRYDPNSAACDFDIPTVVGSAKPFLINATATEATCSEGAVVKVQGEGGTPPYSFILKDSAGKETPFLSDGNAGGILTKISPGKYRVSGIDKNSCNNNGQEINLDITQTNPPQAAVSNTKELCFDSTNGAAIAIDISDGKGPFTYRVSRDGGGEFDAFRPSFAERSFTYTAPAAGPYDFIVMDDNGCTSGFSVSISEEISVKAVLTKSLTCDAAPQNAAIIGISLKGGTGPFAYRVKSNSGTFNGLPNSFDGTSFEYSVAASGTYTFEIIDSKGCTKETSAVIINDPESVTLSYQAAGPSCNGGSDGTILFNTLSGEGPFLYSIDNGQTFQDSYKFGGLSAGIYSYRVKDSNNCIASGNLTLDDPVAIKMQIHTNGMTCGPLTPGSFDVNVEGGGTAPYVYYLYDNAMEVIDSYTAATQAAASALHNFSNLSFGDYFIYVTDANGCEFKSNKLRIEPPPYLTVSGTTVGANCVDGVSITLEVTGGTGPEFTYNIFGIGRTSGSIAATSYTFDKLDQNTTYVFEVVDSNGCPSYLEMKTPSISNLTIDQITTKQVTCYGVADGEVTFTVSRYTATNLHYEVRDNVTNLEITPAVSGSANGLTGDAFTTTLKGLKPGNYSLYVKEIDGTFCSTSEIFQIVQPVSALKAEITSVDNANCHIGALVTVKAGGGTAPFQYAAAVSPAIPSVFDNSNVLELAAPETEWNILVKDANGCTFSLRQVISMDPVPSIALSVPDKCAGENEFAIHITETTAGKGAYSMSIDDGVFTSIDALPYDLAGISSGSHTITVKDANDCTDTKSIKIDSPVKVIATASVLPGCEVNNGVISLTPSGGTGSYSYSINPMHPGIMIAGDEITGLIADTYTITMKDNQNDCTADAVVSLPAATPVTFDATAVNVTCNGAQNGSITVTISNDNNNPPYTYSISGESIASITDQTSSEFANLPAGSYTVDVKSGRGCTGQKIVNITEPEHLEVIASGTQYSCNRDSNGFKYATVTADNVKGGAGAGNYVAYQFFRDGIEVQNGSSNIYTEYDQKGGNYVINVYDKNNCIGRSEAIVITPFVVLEDITINKVLPITCDNLESIKVTVSARGGAGALQYHLTGIDNTVIASQTNATGEFDGLGIGDYLITVDDTNTGCSIDEYYHVFNPNTFEIKVQPVNTEICYQTDDGSIELTLVDTQPVPRIDTGAFDYTITGPMSVSGRSNDTGPLKITGLIAGDYTVTVKLADSPKCEVKTGFHITQPFSKLDIELQTTAITCKDGSNDGTIMAIARGGWTGRAYQYELIGPVSSMYSEENYFDNLTPGHYTVNVKDSKGCIATAEINLNVPDPIEFTAVASVLSCYGDNNGVITVSNTTGGMGSNYVYLLNYKAPTGEVITTGPQQSNVFRGLFSGDYSVTVADGFNCEAVSAIITISDPVKVETDLSQNTKVTCQSDATLTLQARGGTSPYTYSEDGINYGASFNSAVTFSVKPGLHQYWVKDNLGCVSEVSGTVQVEALLPLSVELDLKYARVNCKGEATEMITAQSQGGMGDYRYSLLDKNGMEIRSDQSSGIFDSLSAESSPYTIHVTSGDCEINSASAQITESENALTSDITVSSVSCFGERNGIISVAAQGGTGDIKYAISPNLNMFVDNGRFEKLPTGFYTVIVQDQMGCSNIYKDIEITEPSILTASEIPDTMIPEICKGDKDGAFFVRINGGAAPYFESLDNEAGPYHAVNGSIKEYLNQTGGKHTVYIKDSNQCSIALEVTLPESVTLNPAYEISYDCVNNDQYSMIIVTIDKSNGDGTQVDYSLDSETGPWQPGNIFTNVAAGRHYVAARHTNGCIARSENFEIRTYQPLTLALSPEQEEMNVISVRADGGIPAYEYSFNGEPFTSSNTYKIYHSGNNEVIVRDKNGCTKTIIVPGLYIDVCIDNYFTPNDDGVYDTWGPGCTNIYNNLEFLIFDRYGRLINKYHYGQKWDGRYKGEELPSGDYWYVLKLNDEKDRREFHGHFTLYR